MKQSTRNIAYKFLLASALAIILIVIAGYGRSESKSRSDLVRPRFADCELIEDKGEQDFRDFLEERRVDYPLPESCNFRYFYRIVERKEFRSKLVEFCADMESLLPDKTWNRCVFGVGHGVGRIIDPLLTEKVFKNRIAEMMKKAHEMCGELVPYLYFGDCILGVYNYIGIEVALGNEEYEIDLDDPFSACSSEDVNYKRFCHNQLVAPVFDKVGRNIERAFSLVEMIDASDSEVYDVMSTMASYIAFLDIDFENVYKQCLVLKSEVHVSACVSGYASGLVEIAPEVIDYDYAYRSCMSDLLSDVLKGKCVNRVLTDHLSIKDQKIQAAVICKENVEKRYAKNCDVMMNDRSE